MYTERPGQYRIARSKGNTGCLNDWQDTCWALNECGSVATQLRSAGFLGGQLQRRRGLDWLRKQADSGGRLHVNRSGSKRMTGEVQ